MRAVMGISPMAQGAANARCDADFRGRADERWGRGGNDDSKPDRAALDWIGEAPIRTPGNDEQASSVARAGWWKTGRDQKSPLRRCFKPRPSWRTRCAGFASGCQSSVRSSNDPVILRSSRSRSGRLSGLLSGCPPIDTRPQARAKLGKAQLSDPIRLRKFFAHRISLPFNEMCTKRFARH